MSRTQNQSWDFLGETDAVNVQELPVTAEGETGVTYYAEDVAGHVEDAHTSVVRIDKTPPDIDGMPGHCRIWPADHRLVHVADVSASDLGSGIDAWSVTASSNDPRRDARDIVVRDGSVWLRAALAPHGRPRVYHLDATATDRAGNAVEVTGTCVVRPPRR
jgi:hypothetical protein